MSCVCECVNSSFLCVCASEKPLCLRATSVVNRRSTAAAKNNNHHRCRRGRRHGRRQRRRRQRRRRRHHHHINRKWHGIFTATATILQHNTTHTCDEYARHGAKIHSLLHAHTHTCTPHVRDSGGRTKRKTPTHTTKKQPTYVGKPGENALHSICGSRAHLCNNNCGVYSRLENYTQPRKCMCVCVCSR